jgi:hypothetical protein
MPKIRVEQPHNMAVAEVRRKMEEALDDLVKSKIETRLKQKLAENLA